MSMLGVGESHDGKRNIITNIETLDFILTLMGTNMGVEHFKVPTYQTVTFNIKYF